MTSSNVPADQTAQSVIVQLGGVASISTIAEVMAVMERLDAVLPATDGVKWFNLLYLYVTRAIYGKPPLQGWKDERWLTRLDVAFAQLFFNALAHSYTDPASVPGAWGALFEARYVRDVQRVQFALAGMNAHINRDLPLAVVETCAASNVVPTRGTLEYADYEAVNGIIDAVEPQALQFLATGIEGMVVQDLNVIGGILSNWSVQTARDTAWTNAELLWQVRDLPAARNNLLLVWDRMTGFAGRGLLVPV